MNKNDLTEEMTREERVALDVLRALKIGALRAAMLAADVLRENYGSERRVRRCLRLGAEALRAEQRTVTFARAVEEAQAARSERRARTQTDFRYLCKRLLTRCPGLAKRRVRGITPEECERYLQQAFSTPRGRVKGHATLSAVFHTAQRRGWCAANPLQRVDKPRVREKSIPILERGEIEQLLHAARAGEGARDAQRHLPHGAAAGLVRGESHAARGQAARA